VGFFCYDNYRFLWNNCNELFPSKTLHNERKQEKGILRASNENGWFQHISAAVEFFYSKIFLNISYLFEVENKLNLPT
jgi:hypothetical protein